MHGTIVGSPRDDKQLQDVLKQLVELYEKSNQPEKADEARKELEKHERAIEQEKSNDQ